MLNGSDIQVKSAISLAPSSVLTVNSLDVSSKLFDLNKVMKVADSAMKYVPQSAPATVQKSSVPTDLPIEISRGSIDFKRISAPPLLLQNTVGDILLKNNVFYLNRFRTATLGGRVRGDVAANVISMMVRAKVQGENINTEKALLDLANMKDTLSGTASFAITISGAPYLLK